MHISSSYAKILGEKLFRTWVSPKWVKSKKRRKKERKRERLNNGDNNGQATHGARKHAWRTQAAWANKLSRVDQSMYSFIHSSIVYMIDNQGHHVN